MPKRSTDGGGCPNARTVPSSAASSPADPVHRPEALQRHPVAAVLAEVAELNELAPGDDPVARGLHADHRCVLHALALRAIEPGAGSIWPQAK